MCMPSLPEYQRVDVEHYTAFGIVVCSGDRFDFEITVFFKNSYHLGELLSILEQLASTKFVKVILPDFVNVSGVFSRFYIDKLN